MSVKIVGIGQLDKRLKEAVPKVQKATMKGLIEASILIRRDMDKTSPIIPVDTRNLQHSFYTVNTYGKSEIVKGNFTGKDSSKLAAGHSAAVSESQGDAKSHPKNKPTLIMGFSAFYAIYVHEMRSGTHFQRPGAGAKFFESALVRNRQAVKDIIERNVREGL